jgi:uncharacterized membrane protein
LYSRRTAIVLLVLALLPALMSAAVFTRLPDSMAVHWSMSGVVDGEAGRASGAVAVPAISLILWALFAAVPHLAPASPALERGGRHVARFVAVLFAFLAVVHAQVLLWNLGTEIGFNRTVPVGIGVLFLSVGRLLGHVEPNWIVGIRTYWTLKNPVVWERTHQRAALLFQILGVIYIVVAFVLSDYMLIFLLLPAVFLVLYLPAYSYLLYQQIENVRHRE